MRVLQQKDRPPPTSLPCAGFQAPGRVEIELRWTQEFWLPSPGCPQMATHTLALLFTHKQKHYFPEPSENYFNV